MVDANGNMNINDDVLLHHSTELDEVFDEKKIQEMIDFNSDTDDNEETEARSEGEEGEERTIGMQQVLSRMGFEASEMDALVKAISIPRPELTGIEGVPHCVPCDPEPEPIKDSNEDSEPSFNQIFNRNPKATIHSQQAGRPTTNSTHPIPDFKIFREAPQTCLPCDSDSEDEAEEAIIGVNTDADANAEMNLLKRDLEDISPQEQGELQNLMQHVMLVEEEQIQEEGQEQRADAFSSFTFSVRSRRRNSRAESPRSYVRNE